MFSKRYVRRMTSVITSVMIILSLLLPVGALGPSPLVRSVAAQGFIPPQALLSSEEPLSGAIDSARLDIVVLGDTFLDSELEVSSFELLNGPDGLSVTEAVYSDSTQVQVYVSFGAPIDQDYPDFQIRIDGSELANGVSLTTNKLMISRDEYDFYVTSVKDTADLSPGNGICEDGTGECSLRAAIMEANALYGKQTIYVPAGRYEITEPQRMLAGGGPDGKDITINDQTNTDFNIMDDLTIVGAGADVTVIGPEVGSSISRVFQIDPGKSVKLANLSITGGMATSSEHVMGYGANGDGGGIHNAGSLELRHVNVMHNNAQYHGGGIYNIGTLSIWDSRIYENGYNNSETTVGSGGGIYHTGNLNNLVIETSEIYGNIARDNGGGIAITEQSSAAIWDSKIRDNRANAAGGIYLFNYADLNLHHSYVEDNEALLYSGGGLKISAESGANIEESIFRGNRATGDGGAIFADMMYNGTGYLVIEDSTIEGNFAGGVGGFLATKREGYNSYQAMQSIEMRMNHVGFNSAQDSEASNIHHELDNSIDATKNYWGQVSDPSTTVRAVYGEVNVAPWYTDQTMSRQGPSDALSKLSVQGDLVDPEGWDFSYDIKEYSVPVHAGSNTITLIPELFDWTSTLEVTANGIEVEGDAGAYIVELKPGDNLITITVTSELGPSEQYWISVHKPTGPFIVNSFADGIDIDVGDGVCEAGNGACTLRAAIMEANATDAEDVIVLSEGRYTLDIPGIDEDEAATGDLDVSYPVKIQGAGLAKTTIDGGGIDRVFDIWSDFELFEVTVTGGYAHDGYGGSAIYVSGYLDEYPGNCQEGCYELKYTPYVNIHDAIITDNHSSYEGERTSLEWIGGAVVNEGHLTMQRVTISGNSTVGSGGGLYNTGRAELFGVTVMNNEASIHGGGIATYEDMWVEDSSIHSNTSTETGGAIYNENGYLGVYFSDILNNITLSEDGAAIAVENMDYPKTVTIEYSKIIGNDAAYVLSNDAQTDVRASLNYWGEAGPQDMLGAVTIFPYYLSEDMRDESLSGYPEDLKDLIISTGKLSPAFTHRHDEYVLRVSTDTESVMLTPVLYDRNSTVTIAGEVSGEQAPVEIQLDYGETIVPIVVTASVANDNVAHSYLVVIERPQPPVQFVVNTTSDTVVGCTDEGGDCSLRAAIIQANKSNSHDTIILGPGVYELKKVLGENEQAPDAEWGDLDISYPLTIIGAGSAETIIDASGVGDRILEVLTNEFHLSGVTLTGGVSGDAVIDLHAGYLVEGSYTMTDVVVADNDASYQSSVISISSGELALTDVVIRDNESYIGTIYVGDAARLIARQTLFENNVATGNGGGIFNGGELELTDVVFRGNQSRLGGAIHNNRSMSLVNITFENNKATPVRLIDPIASGGAIFNDGEATIVNSQFIGNVVGDDQVLSEEFGIYQGGAIYNDKYGQMTIRSTIISNNQTVVSSDFLYYSEGGGIYNAGHLSIDKSKIHGNQSMYGGGIYTNGSFLLENSEVYENAGHIGGGLFAARCDDYYSCYVDESDIFPNKIVNTTFHGNEADMIGGGAFMFNTGIIKNSTVSGNQAGMMGGGIYGYVGLMISHTTIVDNLLTGEGLEEITHGEGEEGHVPTLAGSGLFIEPFMEIPPGEGEGSVPEFQRTVIVANSIIYGSDEYTVCEGPIALLGTNIVRDGCGEASIHQTLITDQDPLVGPLADNGGHAPTHALLPGSQALDMAVAIGWDAIESTLPLEEGTLGLIKDELLQVFNPTLDARMIDRSQGLARDIGAYEVEWAPYAILPYYDALREELVIRFGSELGLVADDELAPLLAEHFTVSVEADGELRVVGIDHVSYGEDGRTVILELDAEITPSDTISISVEPNAVRFTSGTHAHWMQELNVLTAWQVAAFLIENAGELEEPMLDIGMIVKALSDGSLERLLEEYQAEFVRDPALIRLLLSLISTKYIERQPIFL